MGRILMSVIRGLKTFNFVKLQVIKSIKVTSCCLLQSDSSVDEDVIVLDKRKEKATNTNVHILAEEMLNRFGKLSSEKKKLVSQLIGSHPHDSYNYRLNNHLSVLKVQIG